MAMDKNLAFINLAQTQKGQFLMGLLSWVMIAPHLGIWESALAVTGAMLAAKLTAHRGVLLFVTTTATTFLETWIGDIDTLEHIQGIMDASQVTHLSAEVIAIACLAMLMLLIPILLKWVALFPGSFLAKRPLVALLGCEFFLSLWMGMPGFGPLATVWIWSMIFTFTPYIWFLAYAIVDQRNDRSSPLLLQMGVTRPFWSPSYLPHGKGAAFLQKYAAKSNEELAVTQLKAIKLLFWANALFAFTEAIHIVFLDHLHIPTLPNAIIEFTHATPYSWRASWLALIISNAKYCLQIAAWAHLFVGVARLVGYRLPRGSWRPLESKSLADYFNRFHFYFKELLVDFFFMPTFLRYFRKHPRLRQFFATFMAAGVGNAIWHFFRDIELVATQGWLSSLQTFTSYAFYCVLLAVGVGFSQMRSGMRIRPSQTRIERVKSFVFIWTFVTCLHLFGNGSRAHSLEERLHFLSYLLGAS
ncbi:MAG: hypothetical protein EBQ82_04150 [Betaproteobacteria bacterium]|nr:hypothetical protein [Betaproteobacteria bacterium]NBY04596.1 hypothetical protein [Betaproteobacteria bacterium]